MARGRIRIGVVAPASRLDPSVPADVRALAGRLYPDRAPELLFHPQCFASSGHFAGDDAIRTAAFVEYANDDSLDAIWFARGGYGSCRIAEAVLAGLAAPAGRKTYLGYSDGGSLLAALYGRGVGAPVHGPIPQDIRREGGEAAVARALAWLVDRDPGSLEPAAAGGAPCVAFNITVLSQLLGTPLQPDLAGHVLMLEDVAEYMYRIDRSLFHITANPAMRQVAGIMLGRCDPIPANEPDFGLDEEQVARLWCERSGIAWLGRADIGHDVGNKVVPFGGLARG